MQKRPLHHLLLAALLAALLASSIHSQSPSVPILLLDTSGPDANQAAALESVLLLRDPFTIRRSTSAWNFGQDQNTRVTVFLVNFPAGSNVVVNLLDGGNQSFNLSPEDVRPVLNTDFVQIVFRLPDGLAPGTCRVGVTVNGVATNTGTFRVSQGSEKWRQDLQYFATQLPLLHVNAFSKISRAQFDQAVADLDRDIPALQDHEIVVRLMRIVAMIGDSHTTLRTEGSTQQFRLYPLSLYWFSDGLYATRAASAYQQVLGMRLVRIGMTDVQLAYAAVGDLIPHENEPWLKALSPAQLVSPEVLQSLRILPDLRSGSFVFRNGTGQEFTVNIASVAAMDQINWVTVPDPTQVPLPLYRTHPDLNYWFDYLDASHTLYLQYNVCQNRQDLPFSQFLQQMQAFTNTHPVERFVIDLRNNIGGDSSILQPLINALASDPSINRTDRLFVIIGRQTFSSGLFNAIDLRQRTNATFVGEATGGKPNAFGEVRSFRLPNSALTVTYSTRLFTTVAGDPPSLFPQIAVELSSADFLRGRDPALEAILNP